MIIDIYYIYYYNIYLFISIFIYLFIGIVTLYCLLFGNYLNKIFSS